MQTQPLPAETRATRRRTAQVQIGSGTAAILVGAMIPVLWLTTDLGPTDWTGWAIPVFLAAIGIWMLLRGLRARRG